MAAAFALVSKPSPPPLPLSMPQLLLVMLGWQFSQLLSCLGSLRAVRTQERG